LKDRLSVEDKWILTRLQKVVQEVESALTGYRFNEYASSLYQFIWHEFCDWYLELAKPSLYGEDEDTRKVTRSVLVHVLRTVLECLHPSAPHITEEIWQMLPGRKGETIMLAGFPEADRELDFQDEAVRFVAVIENIAAVRSLRAQNRVPPSARVNVVFRPNSEANSEILEWGRVFVETLGRTAGLTIDCDAGRPEQSGASVTDSATVFVELAGVVDIDAEVARLKKEIAKLEKKLEQIDRKLSNPNFLEKAPALVVAEQAEKKREIESKIDGLKEHLRSLGVR